MGKRTGNSDIGSSDSPGYRSQAHWNAVSSGPLKEIIDEVKKAADIWLVHAILTQYEVRT
jgi:hypothetical protein